MKKLLPLLLLATTFFSCEEERDYETLLFLSTQQKWNITHHNSHLEKEIHLSEEKAKAFNELNKIIDELDNVKNDLIFVGGGYEDSIASKIAGGNDQLPVRNYFYRDNEYRPYAIDHFIKLVDMYKNIFEKYQIESTSFKNLKSYNAQLPIPLSYPYEKDLFKNANIFESLLIINLVERQILLDIQNVLIEELEKQN